MMSMRGGQDIRFCKTVDGVELAVAEHGSGPPLVMVADWFVPAAFDPENSMLAPVVEEFSRDHRFVMYDTRGCGLSQRHVDDFSLEAWIADLEAVVDALGFERFALFGFSYAAPIAVAYAARHPERVDRMALVNGFATAYLSTSKQDPTIVEEAMALLKIVEIGWGTDSPAFRQVFAVKCLPDGTVEQWRAFDTMTRAQVAPDVAVRILKAIMRINVNADAARVRCPTLAFHMRGDQIIYFAQGRRLASLIPGARFIPLEGRNHWPFADEPAWPQLVNELRAFLGVTPHAPAPSHDKLTPRQLEVLRRVAAGQTDKQIARELTLSPRTVEMHVAGAMRALGSKTRAEAAHRASVQGLLPPSLQ